MIAVESKVTIYEINGKDTVTIGGPRLIVRSHWSREDLVCIESDGAIVTVATREILAAIKNASNSAAWP